MAFNDALTNCNWQWRPGRTPQVIQRVPSFVCALVVGAWWLLATAVFSALTNLRNHVWAGSDWAVCSASVEWPLQKESKNVRKRKTMGYLRASDNVKWSARCNFVEHIQFLTNLLIVGFWFMGVVSARMGTARNSWDLRFQSVQFWSIQRLQSSQMWQICDVVRISQELIRKRTELSSFWSKSVSADREKAFVQRQY